jgi:hypothetical protein
MTARCVGFRVKKRLEEIPAITNSAITPKMINGNSFRLFMGFFVLWIQEFVGYFEADKTSVSNLPIA